MLKFDRIVSYGCSHMSALETVDDEYISNSEKIKEKYGYPHFRKLLQEKKDFSYKEYIERGKNYAWPCILSKNLNVECLNRANPGNSIYKIIWDFESDLEEGNINDKDLILIDLVTPFRLIDFSDEKSVDTLNLNRPSFWKDYLQQGAPFFAKVFTNDFLIFYYMLALDYLASYKKTYQIYFTIPHNENLSFLDSKNHKVLQNMNYKSLSKLDFISSKTLLNDCVFDKRRDRYYGVGHAKPIVHERYAEIIFDELNQVVSKDM